MEDDDRMDEGTREPGNEEDEDEEQEEEHQKERAIAALTHQADVQQRKTCSIDNMHLTEGGTEGIQERARQEEARHRSIRSSVGVERQTEGVHAHQVKCKGSGDPRIGTRIWPDI